MSIGILCDSFDSLTHQCPTFSQNKYPHQLVQFFYSIHSIEQKPINTK